MGSKAVIGLVLAHPDDETFGSAVLVRELADAGHTVVLLSATRGDAGQTGHLGPMSREELAALRVQELGEAAGILGIREVEHLGYADGKLGEVPVAELSSRIADFLERHRVEVVVTFPEDGGNGHPDHIAISRGSREAVFGGECTTVRKLYYFLFGPAAHGRPLTFRLDSRERWDVKRRALLAHRSQRVVIEKYFGDLETTFPESLKYESFALAWTKGEGNPQRIETSLADFVGRGGEGE
ncbi:MULTISPECIES: PIG-L deacetylase family protein [Paenibacillus]|uniref:PIG-L deacetylase family protein n=1 Tax=Paenibacillus TaxID=44249 RepID=UPI0022B89AF7|nr:PIG-L family deacetylase [Paenibacillus caseinilyticus]MCZ8523559.1 PIG-L family deacetylase [Paenibacillus caseinilyticus]